VGLLGMYAVSQSWAYAQPQLLPGYLRATLDWQELYNVTALVPDVSVRFMALKIVVVFGLPVVIGLCYAALTIWGARTRAAEFSWQMWGRWWLVCLVGSWLLWFSLFSVGWIRYAFPILFSGSLFTAAWLHDWTAGFQWRASWQAIRKVWQTQSLSRHAAQAAVAFSLCVVILALAVRAFYAMTEIDDDQSAQQAAEFLNANVSETALIETYDSELFFLLERRYHYPPDAVHVDLIRNANLETKVPITYTPLPSQPDYLVVGPFTRWVGLYEPILATNAFRPWRTVGHYAIYERVH
jgi:hypothetical protein